MCKKSIKILRNCFIVFVGISLSWVAFFMSSRFIYFEISSTVTNVKEKLTSFSTLDLLCKSIDWFLYEKDIGC